MVTLGLAVAGSALGGLVGVFLTGVAWQHREVPAAPAFGWLMAAIAGWGLCQAALLASDWTAAAYVFERTASIAAAQVPSLLLVFVLAYTDRREWLRPRYLAALWAVPAGYTLLVLVGPVSGQLPGPTDVTVVTVGGVTASTVPWTGADTAVLAYNYAVTAVAFALLGHFTIRARTGYRRQAATVAVAATIGLVADVVTRIHLDLHPQLVLTPIALPLVGLVVGWALFRYQFLSVSPEVRGLLVDELPDPVLVLDGDHVVRDHNQAATEALETGDLNGRRLSSVAPGLPEQLAGAGTGTYATSTGDGMAHYDPQVTDIEDQYGTISGRLVVLRDVTGQQRRQDRLEALQTATQRFITARTDERIAELTVTFADRVLDQDATAVFLAEDGALRAVAVNDDVAAAFGSDLTITDESSPLFESYREGQRRVDTIRTAAGETPFPDVLMIPLDEHGVLAIGSREAESFVREDRQFATILARTTQVALAQADRESELRESRATVERRTEQVEFFNGVLRHTLRNALLVIQGRADHLRASVDGDDERHLDSIVSWCADLAELSEEIRDITDTVTASESERLDRVDLTGTIRECVAEVAGEHDATIACEFEEGLAVRANHLVGRVVECLVENAVVHNDSDDPRVEITARTIADRVQVRIADNGPGVTDEMKSTVFERDLDARETAGGFGLYFVSVMMNLYGGTVWFEDNEPRGTVAILEFQTVSDEPKGTSTAA